VKDLKGHKEKIAQIRADMNCSKDFQCSKSGFNNLCKAKDNRIDGYVDCLEYRITCEFKVHFGYGILCHCPLRVYFAKNSEIIKKLDVKPIVSDQQ
jgi:hypothetical protein